MPLFDYTGRNVDGESVSGVIEALESDSVVVQLREQQITPVTILAQPKKLDVDDQSQGVWKKLWVKWQFGEVKLEELAVFCENMSTLLEAGVPIVSATDQLAQSTSSKALAAVLGKVKSKLQAGKGLTATLSQYPHIFSNVFLNIVDVGENTGRLDVAFEQLSHFLSNEAATRKRMSAAMRYPKMVLVALIAAMVVINIFVIPAFVSLFDNFGQELPLATRVLMGTSSFMINHWGILLIGVFLIWLGCRSIINTTQGRYVWDRFKIHLPVLGPVVKSIMLTRFAWSFALMLESGVPLLRGISLVAQVAGNSYVSKKIQTVGEDIENGKSLSDALSNAKLFSQMILQMVAVGEESGRMGEMFARVAKAYEKSTDYAIQKFGDMLEPMLLLFMGLMVMVLALGIFLPMYSIMGKIH